MIRRKLCHRVQQKRKSLTWQLLNPTHGFCSAATTPRLIDAYHVLLENDRIRHDVSQQAAIERLASLQLRIEERTTPSREGQAHVEGSQAAAGVFLWGKVGGGKSMVMDLFYRTTLADGEEGGGAKLRLHYHEFMIKVHQMMHQIENAAPARVVLTKSGRKIFKREPLDEHPIDLVAKAVATHECRQLLCLDEIQVTDSADAMILRHLFEALAREGVCVVFTANVPPEGLYSNPFLTQSREFFEPFVALVRSTMQVILVQGSLDYRSIPVPEQGDDDDQFNMLVNGVRVGGYIDSSSLEARWLETLAGQKEEHVSLITAFGRTLEVERRAGDAARFSFDTLCQRHGDGESLGAPDFVALSEAYRTVFVSDLRPLQPSEREEARRLVLLVDTLYEAQVQLYCSASCDPGFIFKAVSQNDECKLEEKLGYARAVSRLKQMTAAAA